MLIKKTYLGSIILVLLIFICSCNSYYSKIGSKAVVTSKDSTHLANKCAVVFPTDTIYEKIETVNAPDSSVYYKSKIDSLKLVKQKVRTELEIKYKDTCTTLLFEVSNALNTGWEQGYYEGKLAAKKDTTFIIKTITKESTIKIQLAKSQAADYQKQLATQIQRKVEWRTSSLISWAVVLLLFIGTFLYVKSLSKNKLKAV